MKEKLDLKGDKQMRKLVEILAIIFILGIISGIIPGLAMALLYKFPLLIIPVLVIDVVWIFKELVYEGE